MRIFTIASVSVAALTAVALFDAKPADARGGHSSFSGSRSFSAPRASVTTRSFSSNKTFVKSATKIKPTNTLRRAVVHTPRIKHVAKIDKKVLGTGNSSAFVRKTTLGSGKLALGKLPLVKSAAGNTRLVGRLNVPKNFKPKLTLAKAPNGALKLRMAPFVQRHWKKAFFWVALAGVGYVTVPELYYDRFYRCSSVDNPDYDECVSILSYAALEEEDKVIGRARAPMPTTATYRYTANAEPTSAARQTCSFEPFVERQWNRSFVWVQIPQTGNVTVPEDYYDQFYGKLGGEPPNFAAACKVLVEAAAADTVATTGPDLNRTL